MCDTSNALQQITSISGVFNGKGPTCYAPVRRGRIFIGYPKASANEEAQGKKDG